MEKVVINSYEEFEKLLGQQIGVSDYVELSQERINLFADATLDHQWIHVDTERAKVDSPYHSTIAHGYLTLSMLPYLWNQIIQVNNLKMMINYGMDKMKFGQAVLAGQSIRLVTTLQSLANLRGVAKAEIKFAIEIQGEKKKALEGVAVFLYYFNWFFFNWFFFNWFICIAKKRTIYRKEKNYISRKKILYSESASNPLSVFIFLFVPLLFFDNQSYLEKHSLS